MGQVKRVVSSVRTTIPAKIVECLDKVVHSQPERILGDEFEGRGWVAAPPKTTTRDGISQIVDPTQFF
jgi:hypothetical protein